jgi:hypothetical protein
MTRRVRTLTAFLGSAVSALGLATAAPAQSTPPAAPPTALPGYPCPPLLPPSIPGAPAPVVPWNPTTPGTPTQPGAPGAPGSPTAAPAPEAPPAQSSTENLLASSPATRSGNMMGDLLGARSLAIRYSVPLSARFTGVLPGVNGVVVNPNNPGGVVTFGPTPNGTVRSADAAFTSTDLRYTQLFDAGGIAFDRAFARSALQTLLSGGPITPDIQRQLDRLSPADRARLLANRGALNRAITEGTAGLNVGEVQVTSVDALLTGGDITYTAILSGEQIVALPGSSSTVGRVKMSEDNSPLPRDRFIFVYDYFDGVPFTNAGMTVNRFQMGVEKTFLDGRWSAEFRLPFASTLASTYTQGAEYTDTELGNVRLALKRLWTNSDRFNLSSGVGVTLPTADDQVVRSQLGTELYRFENQSVTVEPFVAALFTPNDRLFSQVWGSVNFDTSGGDLTWNRNVFGGSGSARIWDLPVLAVDYQVGYWLVQKPTGTLRGLAPFVELHWNYVIAQEELIREVGDRSNGLGLTVQGIGNQELNLTAGMIMQVGDNVNVVLGGGAPLLQRPDRTFDAQFGARVNYFFGRTARERSGMLYVNSY